MKRVLFWILFAAAYYLAAMYRSQPLMAFCLGMLLLAMASFVQSRLLRKGLSVTFPHGLQTVVLGDPQRFSVQIANACPFGAGHCSLTIRAAYAGQAGPGDTIRLKGMAEPGEKQLYFSLSAPYCGLLLFRLDRLAVWDGPSLFCAKKALAAEAKAAVFPPWESLSITLSRPAEDANLSMLERAGTPLSEEPYEIRQLREYRMGDRDRFIHWNLSARTDGLWMKEFEGQRDRSLAILLVWEEETLPLVQQSSFFRLFSALLYGLLQIVPRLSVFWREEEGRPVWDEATDEDGCRRLLVKLYRLAARGNLPRYLPAPEERQDAFLLDTGLGLYWGERLLHRFSPDELEQEIREKRFLL